MARDWRDTLSLPQTELAMRARLPEREPDILGLWQKLDLYKQLRHDSAGREKFVLHDGPPYANGHLHMGHALNKILKDVVNRSQQMLGKDANYVPGWDCHGLPIEWKIEEGHREAGRSKEDVPVADFRRECRQFAEHWVGVQATEFRRLGIVGDWDGAYTTMSFDAEAKIVRELGKFLLNGSLYRGAKPVMWSVVEKTALAEAEIEYHDHTSTMCWVRFAIQQSLRPELDGVSALIWTTTPWTLPGNRAIAYGVGFAYVVLEVVAAADGSEARLGEKLLVAEALVDTVVEATSITQHRIVTQLPGDALQGVTTAHPLAGQGYDFVVPLLAGDHVTLEQGTGLVHIAPGHGAEDWELGRAHDIAVPETVDGDGTYFAHVPLFGGCAVYRPDGKAGNANGVVLDAIKEAGGLLAKGRLVHAYPHSWRSKAPLIFRNTPQWFISMEMNDLRTKALAAIDQTRFVPSSGYTRLRGMIAERPDWCVSRQRAWGVPITVFIHKETGEPLRDAAVMDRIVAAVAAEGADAWFDSPAERFLGSDYAADQYEPVMDILDVWFDSGCSHAYVLETRDDLAWPASLYLEGSDQHRGWFHSSLLESCGTRGRAPYDEVLTHGFVLDEQGRAMSKSLGNGMAPEEIIQSHGADVLRLWVVASDYYADLRIGPDILKHQADAYRRLRNTLRFVLGNLHAFSADERLPPAEMPDLERWVLHRLWETDGVVRRSVVDYDFHAMYTALHTFCAVDLSAFYFDIRKDALYCDTVGSIRRRAARTVLDTLFDCLTAWLAPILCFTAEEAWQLHRGDGPQSVHQRLFPNLPDTWRDDVLASRWSRLRTIRRVVTGALELARADKTIGASLQAHPVLHVPAADAALMVDQDMADLAITSGLTISSAPAPDGAYRLDDVPDVAVVLALADGDKCGRCWRVLPDVVADADDLCHRCRQVVNAIDGSTG